MEINMTAIVEAIFVLIGVIITTVIVPYIKARTTEKQRENINGWVKVAVAAAEQLFQGTGRGVEKKQYVLEWLTAHNIEVDATKMDAMIEAAVHALKEGLL